MTRATEVGSDRTYAAIEKDPQATAEEVRLLSLSSPIVALNHPNCPIELWWELAAEYPLDAASSLLYDLFTLEEPARWGEMEREEIGEWIRIYGEQLPSHKRTLFAMDCVEHVLPLWESKNPKDQGPWRAIQAQRQYANGKLSQDAWEEACNESHEAGDGAETIAETRIAHAAGEDDFAWAATLAAESMFYAEPTTYSGAKPVAALDAEFNERLWQWDLLQKRLPKRSKTGGKDRVGARFATEVINDPQATEEEIKTILNPYPMAQLHHCNCPEELWWSLASVWVVEAMRSPLFELNTLAAPERWQEMEQKKAALWIRRYLKDLKENQQRLFAADCAEHVLHLFETVYPIDKAPRIAIETARHFATHPATQESIRELRRAFATADKSAAKAFDNSASYDAFADAAQAAAYAANLDDGFAGQVVAHAASAAGYAAYALPDKDAQQTSETNEMIWQWHHLLGYLQQAKKR